MTKARGEQCRTAGFVIGHSGFFRHSDLVIRHCESVLRGIDAFLQLAHEILHLVGLAHVFELHFDAGVGGGGEVDGAEAEQAFETGLVTSMLRMSQMRASLELRPMMPQISSTRSRVTM
jgi:hypothetical protein